MSTQAGGDSVGSVAEEAMRLVASMTAWAQTQGDSDADTAPPADGKASAAEGFNASDNGDAGDVPGAGDQAENAARTRHQGHLEGVVCGVCPICRGASFLDHLPSETIAKAADMLGFFATALSDLAVARGAGESSGQAAPDEPGPAGSADGDTPADGDSQPDGER